MANGTSEGEGAPDSGGRSLRVERHDHAELLPRLPNEIVINLIVPKLHVADVLTLPLISHAWRHAVQRREVESARRLRFTSHLLEVVRVSDMTLNLIKLRFRLQSFDKSFFRTLPPIPRSWTRNDRVYYKHACLAGRVYVLVANMRYLTIRTTVYSFDVTRGGQWVESARSHVIIQKLTHRQSRCCVNKGKFYVSGLLFPAGVGPGHVTYDTKLESWSSTTDFGQEASTGRCICRRTTVANMLYDRCWV